MRTDKLAALKVPPTLTALLQARLDGSPRPEREALQRASVVGRLFWDDAVAELLEAGRETVVPTLEAVRGRELIFRREHSAFAGAGEYIFKHALLRDVAYETVLLKQRADYHGRAARWLESHAGERRDEYLTLIAEHYIQAGEGLRAAALLEQAGHEAWQIGAWPVARQALERALALREAAGDSDSAAVRAALIDSGYASTSLGDFAAAEAALERGLGLARAAGDSAAEAEALVSLATVALTRGDSSRAWTLIEAALPIGRAHGSRLLSRIQNQAAWTLWSIRDLDAAEAHANEALAAGRAAGDLLAEARALDALGAIAANRRELEQSRALFSLSLELARRANHLSQEANALGHLSAVTNQLGDYVAARDYGRSAGDLYRELGGQADVIYTLGSLAHAELKLGDVAGARRGAREALLLARSIGAVSFLVSTVFVFGQILAETGQPARALALYGLARAHPNVLQLTQLEVDEELARLGLPADEVAAGLAAGAALDFETVVEEILAGKW